MLDVFKFIILHFAFCILHFAFCILHFAFCILHSAFCILHSAFCILHSAFCILHSAFCILHFLATPSSVVKESRVGNINIISSKFGQCASGLVTYSKGLIV
ncbi:MAG TPA: hypothetical protein ENJ95_11315 [Bacteroidetes bacterium]|nr:hypothetical protein [Bacteroidota bacterium]